VLSCFLPMPSRATLLAASRIVKPSRLIAALLVLNLGLFLGILFYFLRTQMGAPVVSASPEEPAPSVHPGHAAIPAAAQETVVIVTNALDWSQLESEDYQEYIARLRAIGCPEQTIRELIIADLDKVMAPEIQALHGRKPDLKYWHSEEEEMANDVDQHELAKKEREIEKRKRDIIRELVSADLARERMKQTGQEDYHERRLAFLPEERRTQVRELLERFDEAEQGIREKELDDGEPLSLADREQLRVLREQRESELGSLLTPQEREQLDLWMSPTANSIRYALYGMKATEQEFVTIYRARKPFDDRWARRDVDLLDESTQRQMEQEQAQTEEAIRQGLGDSRYAEYKRGEDEDYHRLNALATRFKLPKEKAVEAYGYKKVVQDYRAQLQTDPNLTPVQKTDALKAIGDESAKALRTLLGDKAYRYYVRTGQAAWVRE
jgi:hypothetical protein